MTRLTFAPTQERGLARTGAYADLVLFDPARIIDHGTLEDPKRYRDGIAAVWVIGRRSVREGRRLEMRARRPLRRKPRP